jgi:hypothetical protein
MDISKEDLQVFLEVIDKMEIYSKNNTNGYYNMFVNILFGVIFIALAGYFYFIYKDDDKVETKQEHIAINTDNNISCSNGICKTFY